MIGMTAGYIIGGGVSTLFGLGVFDISSILIGAVCALVGIYVAYTYF